MMIALAAFVAIAGRGPIAAQQLEHISIVATPSDSGGEIYYAQERGLFKKHGLEVEIIGQTSGAAVAAAMASGKYDIGQGNIATVAAAHEAGLPFVLIAPGAVYSSQAATTALVVAKDSPIKTAADLVGKTVANVSLQDVGTVALDAWLANEHVSRDSIHVIELPLSSMTEALNRGTVAAAIMLEPYLSAGLTQSTRVLALPYTAIAPRFLINAYYARADWVQAHPQTVRAFVAVIAEAGRWANANHALSAQFLMRTTNVSIAPNQVRSVYADTLDVAQLQPMIDAAARSKMLKKPFPASALLNP